jgi:hypothetical protein
LPKISFDFGSSPLDMQWRGPGIESSTFYLRCVPRKEQTFYSNAYPCPSLEYLGRFIQKRINLCSFRMSGMLDERRLLGHSERRSSQRQALVSPERCDGNGALREEKSFSLLRSGVSQVSAYRSRNRLKVGCFRRSGRSIFLGRPQSGPVGSISLCVGACRLQALLRALSLY